jgi:dihydroneopterin aldolase
VRDDRLDTTINYSAVYKTVRKIVEDERYHLLESVALRIREEIMKRFSPDHVLIRCRKPKVPLKGDIEYVEIEIT